MVKVLAIILLICLFPAVFAAVVLGILVHPLFFLGLMILILVIPSIGAARR